MKKMWDSFRGGSEMNVMCTLPAGTENFIRHCFGLSAKNVHGGMV